MPSNCERGKLFHVERVRSIIFTVTNDLNYDQRMQRICRSLHHAGYAVMLIGRERKSSKPLLTQPFSQKRISCFYEEGKIFYIEYNLRLLFWLLFSRKADCYSAVDLDTILPCLIAARIKGKKLVYDAHEYFTEVPEVINRPMVKKVWLAIERFSVPKVNKAYTVSASIARLFEEKYKVHFEVIRNVPHKMIADEKITTENYILYQGALNVGRAIEHYIKAMHHINCVLYIAGEGDLSEQLRVLVKSEKLENKVRFLGFVAPNDLKKITARAKIGLNCAENLGLSYYYSLNNKMFDYIMAGIPQLISDFPEFIRINEEYHVAMVIQDLTPESLSSAINRMLLDEQLYSQLKANCIKAREVLNWENEEKKMLAVYADI